MAARPSGKEPAKLPHPNEDPSHLAARQAKADYYQAMQKARGDWRISDLEKAEQINKAYETYTTTLTKSYEDLYARRRTRLEWAEAQVPFGPGVTADTTPADKAVLISAFRVALDKVRAADLDERHRLLREAEAFDDDTMRRAVLTAAAEDSHRKLLDEWAAPRPGMAALVDEVVGLRRDLRGAGTNRGFERQDLFPEKPPQEARALPGLRAAQQKQEEARLREVQSINRVRNSQRFGSIVPPSY